MMDAMQIRNIVGGIGNAISLGLFLSPSPTFYQIVKKKAVEQYSPIPYLATILNCAIWVLYAMPFVTSVNMLILTINGFGLVLEAAYLTIFLLYSTRQGRLRVLKILACEILFFAIVVGIVAGGVHVMAKRKLIVGILAVIFGTCMYASPLSVMKLVIQTKSVKYMPFTLSLVSFINGLCWTAYALLHFDIFVIIPNGMGTLLGLAQLILYACYYSSTPKDDDPNKSEVQMSGSSVAPGTV